MRYGITEKFRPGKIGNLSNAQKITAALAVMNDVELWSIIKLHYDDVQWPEDFTLKLGRLVRGLYASVDWADLAFILATLRSEAARPSK